MSRNDLPTYLQIKRSIKRKIKEGIYKSGQLIPSRAELSKEYECSWGTLNRAVNELMLEGVLVSQTGKGTFVAQNSTNKNKLAPIKVWICYPFPSVYAALSELLDGLRSEAYNRGRNLRFTDNGYRKDYPSNLNGYIVVTPSNDQLDYLLKAWKDGQRFVVLNSDFENVPFVCVNGDLYHASYEVMKTLLNYGHQKIGLLGLREGFSNYESRKQAYIHAFESAEMSYSEDCFVGRPETPLDMKDLFSDWFNRHPDCTAVYAADYTSALVILEILGERKVQIPEEVSVFASGNVPFASLLKISLNTVLQPFNTLGKIAVATLLDEDWCSDNIILPCEVREGNSIKSLNTT